MPVGGLPRWAFVDSALGADWIVWYHISIMTSTPAFYVRDIPVYGRAILSPMDGYSDLPFRLICRELGSAMSYTEFVNVDELANTRKMDTKAWRKLKFHPNERPMTFQIYGHDENRLVDTALRLQDYGPNIIDINMGCYVKD